MTHSDGSEWEVLLLHVAVDEGVCTQEMEEPTQSPAFLLYFVQHILKLRLIKTYITQLYFHWKAER